jgi:hypothetical protein
MVLVADRSAEQALQKILSELQKQTTIHQQIAQDVKLLRERIVIQPAAFAVTAAPTKKGE